MIKRFIDRVFGKRAERTSTPSAAPLAVAEKVYSREQHRIHRDWISSAALRTCEGLQQSGYKAYVVGGAVRDLLLGRHPKDFDVATDATPEQVRAVFRRSRIIGRRFRLVHVMFGQETVEVSTFRGAHSGVSGSEEEIESIPDPEQVVAPERNQRRVRPVDSPNTPKAVADAHGRLLRDNVFGTQQEDAIRRDFTMNALFYDPAREEVVDYVNGVADIARKRVVMIGDPIERYKEDPVRMLRAARLSAKLGFTIDDATRAAIGPSSGLLANVPEARLFDELMKMLLSGHAQASLARLRELELDGLLIPSLGALMSNPSSAPMVTLALTRTDERVQQDKGVNPAFLFAALYWPLLEARQQSLLEEGSRPLEALHQAMDDVLDTQRRSLAIPRRYDGVIKELWMSQSRFEMRSRGKAFRTLSHPRFRACYDFYELRAAAGNASTEVAEWWTEFQTASEERRETMLLPDEPAKKKRRRKRKPNGGAAGGGASDAPTHAEDRDEPADEASRRDLAAPDKQA